MNYKEFKDYIENMVPYETIYEDGEGRMILVIKMSDAFTAMNRKWVGLTDEEMGQCSYDAEGFMIGREVAMRAVETKLKEKNT